MEVSDEFAITESPLEVDVSVPASEAEKEAVTTESPGLFSSFFGGGSEEPIIEVAEAPESNIPLDEPVDNLKEEQNVEVDLNVEDALENLPVEPAEHEYKFYEPGQAPEYVDNNIYYGKTSETRVIISSVK